MARTRQKRKAKQRREQQQQQATRRDATAKQQPSNPAEQAAIQTAEALEAGDELEEIARGEEPAAEAPVAEPPAQEQEPRDVAPAKERERRPAAVERKEPRKEARKEAGRERKPAPERRKEPRKRGRVANFLVQVWAELRRVQWPDRNQVTQATGVVVVFCFLAGAFLALFDYIFSELVTRIL
jgi:preprotein translocase subunit SecE